MLSDDKKMNDQIKTFAKDVGELVLNQEKTDKVKLLSDPTFLDDETLKLATYLQKSAIFDEKFQSIVLEFNEKVYEVVVPNTSQFDYEKVNSDIFRVIKKDLNDIKKQLSAEEKEFFQYNIIMSRDDENRYSTLELEQKKLVEKFMVYGKNKKKTDAGFDKNKALLDVVTANFFKMMQYAESVRAQQITFHNAREQITQIEKILQLLIRDPAAPNDQKTVSRSSSPVSPNRDNKENSPPSTPSTPNRYQQYQPASAGGKSNGDAMETPELTKKRAVCVA